MNFQWGLLSVELCVCAWIVIMLVADLISSPADKRSLWKLALLGALLCSALLIQQQPAWLGNNVQGMWVVDRFGGYFKGLFLLTTAIVIVR